MVGRDVSLAGACSWDIEVLRRLQAEPQIPPTGHDWYRIADGLLGLDCDHVPVTDRWREIYHDCRSPGPSAGLPSLTCSVRAHGAPFVRLDCHDPLGAPDPVRFTLYTDPDQRFVELPAAAGWRFLARAATPDIPFAAFFEDTVLLDPQQPWEPFVAHYTFHRALRLQPDLMVFHAASVAVDGRGVMLVGPKGAGKTTLSVTLASLGHGFFGDEFAALRRSSLQMLPFRRALSIRRGPAPAVVQEAIGSGRYEPQVYPDGTPRYRIPPSELVGSSGQEPVPLAAIYFLRSFVQHPQVENFAPGLEHVRLLTPLGSTVAEAAPSQTIRDFLRLLRHARCYFIDPGGSPENTAEAILRSLEAE